MTNMRGNRLQTRERAGGVKGELAVNVCTCTYAQIHLERKAPVVPLRLHIGLGFWGTRVVGWTLVQTSSACDIACICDERHRACTHRYTRRNHVHRTTEPPTTANGILERTDRAHKRLLYPGEKGGEKKASLQHAGILCRGEDHHETRRHTRRGVLSRGGSTGYLGLPWRQQQGAADERHRGEEWQGGLGGSRGRGCNAMRSTVEGSARQPQVCRSQERSCLERRSGGHRQGSQRCVCRVYLKRNKKRSCLWRVRHGLTRG